MKLWELIGGGRFFEAGRLLNFHNFHQVASLFCTQKITKRDVVPENFTCSLKIERFYKILRNLDLRGSLSLSPRSVNKLSGTPLVYFSFLGVGCGRLLAFPT